MAQVSRKEPIMEQHRVPQAQREDEESRERIIRESAERYRRSVNEVNRTRDSDIERALRS